MNQPLDIQLTHTFSGHAGAIFSVSFDGQYIYTSGADKFVARWNPETGEQDRFAIQLPQTAYAIRVVNQGRHLVVGLSTGEIHVFDLETRKEIKHFVQHGVAVFSILACDSEQRIYIGDADGVLTVWNTASWELEIAIPLSCGKIRRMVADEEKNQLIICAQDGTVRVLDTLTFNELFVSQAHEGGVTSCEVISDELLITGGKDAHLKVWDRLIMSPVHSIPAHNFVIYDICKAQMPYFLTASRDKTIKLWDIATMKPVKRIGIKDKGHSHSVNAVLWISAFAFVSVSDDGKLKLWKVV